jgi:hypothetical protein
MLKHTCKHAAIHTKDLWLDKVGGFSISRRFLQREFYLKRVFLPFLKVMVTFIRKGLQFPLTKSKSSLEKE